MPYHPGRPHPVVFGLFLAGLIALAGPVTTAAQDDVPWPADAWPVSTPEAEGVNPDSIIALHADIAHGRYGFIDQFVLIRHGKIVADFKYEQNYNAVAARYDTTNHQYNYDHPDWHPYYRNTDLHTLQSVTKSVTSAALGIAIDEGYISGVDFPVMELFEEYEQDFSDPRRSEASLEDLLTMRSGIKWNEMTSYNDAENSCIIMEASDNWLQYVLQQPMADAPGTRFDYNSGVSVLLGKVIRITTGKRADVWTEEKLFTPIGIEEYYWKITPQGEVDTEGGLYLSSHDLARIGYLFLHDGMWNGRQVVSKEWVRASIAPVVEDIRPQNDSPDAGYGYQWWIPNKQSMGTDIFAGNGYGGQYLMVAPAYDLVLVFNGWNIHGGGELSSWQALKDRILPAIQNNG